MHKNKRMGLSVITPHYNDLDGLKRVYTCLKEQTCSDWEWIIVDDFSDKRELLHIDCWINNTVDKRVRFIHNSYKTNASVCRNMGAEIALYENLVFLDADDYISQNFVEHRDILCNEFAIFKNRAVVDVNGTHEKNPSLTNNFLDYFLKAKFIWQTTSILWEKKFFIQIGKFDPNLQRLQDVELSIRALIVGKNYQIIDNEIDFFYNAKPINSKLNIVSKSCLSVNYLILKIRENYTLDTSQHNSIKSYYYACVKGLHRCKNRTDVVFVKESLNLFYKEKYIGVLEYVVGLTLLILYRYHLISDSLFIRSNRYVFKVK